MNSKQSIEKYVLIKDLEGKKFEIWSEYQLKIYQKSCEEVGAAPSISEVFHFDWNTDAEQFKAQEQKPVTYKEIEELLDRLYYKEKDLHYKTQSYSVEVGTANRMAAIKTVKLIIQEASKQH